MGGDIHHTDCDKRGGSKVGNQLALFLPYVQVKECRTLTSTLPGIIAAVVNNHE
jgi:hypothetical protein